MKIKIRGLNLFDGAIGQITSLTFWCLLISEIAYVHATDVLALPCLYGLVICFVFWLATCIMAIVRKKPLPAMPEKAKIIVGTLNWVLFMYWIISKIWPAVVTLWVLPIIWVSWLSAIILTIKRRA